MNRKYGNGMSGKTALRFGRCLKKRGQRMISCLLVMCFSATMSGLPGLAQAISWNDYKSQLTSSTYQLPATDGQAAGTTAEDAFTALPASTLTDSNLQISTTNINTLKTEGMTVGDFRLADFDTYAGSMGQLDTSLLSGIQGTDSDSQVVSAAGDQQLQAVAASADLQPYSGVGEITLVAALSQAGITGLPATTGLLSSYQAGSALQTGQIQAVTETAPVAGDSGETTIQISASQPQESQAADTQVVQLGTGLQSDIYPIGQRPLQGEYNSDNALHRQGAAQESEVVQTGFTSTQQYVEPTQRQAQFSERIAAVDSWVQAQRQKVEETRQQIESGQSVDLRAIFRGSQESTVETRMQESSAPAAASSAAGGDKTVEQRLAEVEQQLGITPEPGADIETRVAAAEAKVGEAQTVQPETGEMQLTIQQSAPEQEQTVRPAAEVAATSDYNILQRLFSSGNENGLKMSETVGKTASALSTPSVAVKDRIAYIDQAMTPTLKIMGDLTEGTTDYQNANTALAFNRLAAYIVAADADREKIRAEIDVYVAKSGDEGLKALASEILDSPVALGASSEAVRNDQAKRLLSAFPGEQATDIFATAGTAVAETAPTGAETLQTVDQTVTYDAAAPADSYEKPVLNAMDVGNQVLNSIDLEKRPAFTGVVGNIRTAMESTTMPEARFNMITASLLTPTEAMKTDFADSKSAAAANRMMVYYKAAQYVALNSLDEETCAGMTIPDKQAALAEIKQSMQDLAGAVQDPTLDNFVNYITDDTKNTEQDQLDKVNLVRTALGQAEAATDSSVTSPELPATFIDNSQGDNQIEITAANIGKGGQVGTHVAIGAGSTIGDGVSIYANTHLGSHVTVGDNVIIEGGSWIEDGVVLPDGAHVVGLITQADVESADFKKAVAGGTIYGKKETVSDTQLRELGLATRADVAAIQAESSAPATREYEDVDTEEEEEEEAPATAAPAAGEQTVATLDTTGTDRQLAAVLQSDTPDVNTLKQQYNTLSGRTLATDTAGLNQMLKYQAAIYVLDPSSQSEFKTKIEFNISQRLGSQADPKVMAAITRDSDGKVLSIDKDKLTEALGGEGISVTPAGAGDTVQQAESGVPATLAEKRAAVGDAPISTLQTAAWTAKSGVFFDDPALFNADGSVNEEVANDPLKRTEYRDNVVLYEEILDPTRLSSPSASEKDYALQYVIANGVNPLASSSTYTCMNGKTIQIGAIITEKNGYLNTMTLPSGWAEPKDDFLAQSETRDAKIEAIFGTGWHVHISDSQNIALAVEYCLKNDIEIPADHKADIPDALKTKYPDYKYKDTLYTGGSAAPSASGFDNTTF